MYKLFFVALAAFIVSSMAQAGLEIEIRRPGAKPIDKTNQPQDEDSDAENYPGYLYYRGSSIPLSYGDMQSKVNVIVKSDTAVTPTVKVFCGADTTAKKTKTATEAATSSTFPDWVIPASDDDEAFGVTGNLCKFEATATADGNTLTTSFPFVLGCPETPCFTARGGVIKSGQPFMLDNFSINTDDGSVNKLEFAEIRLDSCTASSDPELFVISENGLQRAYPVLVGSTTKHNIKGLFEDGGGWGTVENMFFIGDGAGCNFTVYREAIIGGSNFTSSCALNLASTAAVSIQSGNEPKIMVKLGAKPTGAKDSPAVYVSGNGGHTWKKADAAVTWSDTAQNSEVRSSADNSRNRALVKITAAADNSVCWQMIKGS